MKHRENSTKPQGRLGVFVHLFALLADPTSGVSRVYTRCTLSVCFLGLSCIELPTSLFIRVIYSRLFEEREDTNVLFSALPTRFALNSKVHFSLQNIKLTTNVKPG